MANPFESKKPPAPERARTVEWRERLSSGCATIAKERADGSNEDRLVHLPELGFFAVCDGVGGHAHGEQAAETAAHVLRMNAKILASKLQKDKRFTGKEIEAWMRDALQDANDAIREEAAKDRDERGTTAVAAQFVETDAGIEVVIGWVGDSRAYKAADLKSFEPLTVDDSYALPKDQREIDGILSPSDVRGPIMKFLFENRAVIQQWLGKEEIVPHVLRLPVAPGERILLTSDGPTDNLTIQQIRDTLDAFENEKTAMNRLVAQAHKISLANQFRSKPDDISGILILVKK